MKKGSTGISMIMIKKRTSNKSIKDCNKCEQKHGRTCNQHNIKIHSNHAPKCQYYKPVVKVQCFN